jgi:hypothetical protein
VLSLKTKRQLRILDLDIETRRIGFHNGGRFNPDGCEPVIIAAAWEGELVQVWGLRSRWTERDAKRMISGFRQLWDEADVVTGHYIRKFDLPILNGACLEWGIDPLTRKPTIDTKLDLLDIAGMSQSQENLSALKELEASKFHMNDTWWRKVARLTPEGLALAETRVIADVHQHQVLRESLHQWLKPPVVWRP